MQGDIVMDWREMAGRLTVRGMQGENRWSSYAGAYTFNIYYLYYLIRRPRMILDFALIDHLVLITYYSTSIPYDFPSWPLIFH